MQNTDTEQDAGRYQGQFNTTHWSVVLRAGMNHSAHSAAALESLCRIYWQPIYVFARRQGYSEEDAKDLTQHFFCKLLERDDFNGLDPRKGKFRTFLLTAFSHLMANEYDRASAFKRGGGKIILSLEELPREEPGLNDPAAEQPAARGFDRQWAKLVVKQALESLKLEMGDSQKSSQFEALKSFLTVEAGPGDYARAACELGLAESSVPVLVHRMRQRYRQLVRAQVAHTVTSPAELNEEMRHLFDVLNQ